MPALAAIANALPLAATLVIPGIVVLIIIVLLLIWLL